MSAHIEATLDALVTKLQTNMPAKVAAINSEHADDYDIDVPAALTISTRAELVEFPHIMVLPEETEPELDPGQYIVWRHTIRTISWLSEWDEETLARKLLRYGRAVREVILSSRDPDLSGTSGGYGLKHVRDEYGPVFRPDREGYFVQAVASLYRVSQQQSI